MNTTIPTLLLVSISLLAYGQEMETEIWNTNDIHLSLKPDSVSGSSRIFLERTSDQEAVVNFRYRNEPYTFDPEITGGTSDWKIGVNYQPAANGDFSITNEALFFDLLIKRDHFVIRSDNGYTGIGGSLYERPSARLDIDHLSPSASEPALIVGANCTACGYMEVHKPKFDQSSRVAQWSDNGTWSARLNNNGSFYKFEVNGNYYSSTGNYYGPFIILAKTNIKSQSAVASLDNLKLIQSNEKVTMDTYGLGIDELKKTFPQLIKEETSEDGEIISGGVNYVGLVPILVAAHQEAKAEITALKERLARLEAVLDK